MSDTSQRLQEIDGWIRGGEIRRAQLALKDAATSKWDRAEKPTLASLAWRAGVPLVGIRLLNPIVRPSAKKPVQATSVEKKEYAACLIRIGATEEAGAILGKLSAERDPQVWLYRTFASVARWEYAETIPWLKAYLASPALSDYQRLVGEANLAAALVYERRFNEADSVLAPLIEATRRQGARLLLGSALDLAAECQIAQKRWEQAEKSLEHAEAALRETETLNAFFLRKWTAAVRFGRAPRSAAGKEALAKIRLEAGGMGHWETVRFCDRLAAVWGENAGLFAHVYYGTPFASFRAWMERDWSGKAELPETYSWRADGGGGEAPVFDADGALWKETSVLKRGHLIHRLLLALASDFYRPFRLAVLHHRLYPDAFFHPVHSPPRLYDAVQRFRKWTEETRVPLEIVEKGGTYRLHCGKPVALRLSRDRREPDALALKVEPLRRKFGEAVFSVRGAVECLAAPERSVRRLLSSARQAGWLEGIGKGPSTRYRLVAGKKK